MIPTIGIYMHRRQPFHPMQLAALAHHTKQSYDLIIVNEPGTVHENINKVFRRCNSQYLILMDDDCIVTQDDWLENILEALQSDTKIGCVVPMECKNMRSLRAYRAAPESFVPATVPLVADIPWCPGYMMAFDMYRVPGLEADEKIPFPKGMSDLDLSLQVISRGFTCKMCTQVIVYHPFKGNVTKEQNIEYASQNLYMRSKWGAFYEFVIQKSVGTILNTENRLEENDEDISCRPDHSSRLNEGMAFPLGSTVA